MFGQAFDAPGDFPAAVSAGLVMVALARIRPLICVFDDAHPWFSTNIHGQEIDHDKKIPDKKIPTQDGQSKEKGTEFEEIF